MISRIRNVFIEDLNGLRIEVDILYFFVFLLYKIMFFVII